MQPGLGALGNLEGDFPAGDGEAGSEEDSAGGRGRPRKGWIKGKVSVQLNGSPGMAWQEQGPQVEEGQMGVTWTGKVLGAEARPCRMECAAEGGLVLLALGSQVGSRGLSLGGQGKGRGETRD